MAIATSIPERLEADTGTSECQCDRPTCLFDRLSETKGKCENEPTGPDMLCDYCRDETKVPHCHKCQAARTALRNLL